MFKVKHKPCSEITCDIFMGRTNNQYNLHDHPDFITPPHIQSVFHGTESIPYLGPKMWNIVPEEVTKIRNHQTVLKNPSKCGYQLIVPADFAKFT